MAPLEGKVAAITGASSGIGEATAIALAQAGAKVSLAARRADRLEALVEKIGADRALAIETDVADEEQARRFVQRTKDELGSVDVLVNNAGVMLLGLVLMQSSDDWRRMIEVNQLGLLYCSHEALKVMSEQGSGHIVNVSSVAGRIAALGSAVYNMTKWGVNGFSEALRQEGVHVNVRVTVVEPGFVDTELQGHNENPAVVAAMEKAQAEIGEVLQAHDIAQAILYAVSQPPHVAVNEVLVRPTKQLR
jgi:NADP-dependent 3-hydroxy acid dehydrogenase YdfG